MIVYFADRNLNILTLASSTLPEGLSLSSDSKKESIDSGTASLQFDVGYSDSERKLIDKAAVSGNYVLCHRGGEDEFYCITSVEVSSEDMKATFYCEDAGLDLLNSEAGKYEGSSRTLSEYCNAFLSGTGWQIGIDESSGTQSIKWDSESTLTERLLSLASYFDCELYYSFDIQGLKVVSKEVNFRKTRGNGEARLQLRLGREVDSITTKKSIENLATALSVTGGNSVSLKGYSYSYTDPDTEDIYTVDSATGQMRNTTAMDRWKGVLDTDGLIIRQYSSEETDKAKLAGEARAALQGMCFEEVNYEVSFNTLDARIGDRVNIIDDKGELYLDARILELTTSECENTVSATLGEYLIRGSGISARLTELAKQTQKKAISSVTLKITSSEGITFSGSTVSTVLTVKVFYEDEAITNASDLAAKFGSDTKLCWYEDETPIPTTDTRISAGGFTFTITNQSMEDKTSYTCRLERS